MKQTLLVTSLALLVLALTPFEAGAEPGVRPNIVYILVDNWGWGDLGVQGSTVPTPNIDELAAQGLRMTNFNVQNQCTPTRSALHTGRLPIRSGTQKVPAPGYLGSVFDGEVAEQPRAVRLVRSSGVSSLVTLREEERYLVGRHDAADFAFEEDGLTVLESGARITNAASRRVLEKCGFEYQGFGMSYLIQFPAPRWVQCAYTPAPVYEEYEEEEYEDLEEEDLEESWSCPSHPPELW